VDNNETLLVVYGIVVIDLGQIIDMSLGPAEGRDVGKVCLGTRPRAYLYKVTQKQTKIYS